MDKGELVPDDVIIGVISERIQGEDASDGFILDGFPRTVPQAEALETSIEKLGRKLTAAILIETPEEEIVKRLSGRRTCEEGGHVFHVDFNPPKQEGVCDVDGCEADHPRRRQARGRPEAAASSTARRRSR